MGRRWDILAMLYKRSYTATELDKEMDKMSLSWVSSQLKELRKAGLVDFEKGADKRSKLWSLTESGSRICSTYFQELQPALKRVIEDENEVDIWLKQLKDSKSQDPRESIPPALLKIMYKRLGMIAKTNPTQCLRMSNYFLNRIKVDVNLESSHRELFILLRELAPKSDKIMNELKNEEEQLKGLALGWLRRAKEDPRNSEVNNSRDAYLEALRLIRVVLDKKGKKEFFINLFKESIAPPHVTVDGIPSYMWPLRFIEDKADLLRELIEMASKERDEETRRRILDVIKSFDSSATFP